MKLFKLTKIMIFVIFSSNLLFLECSKNSNSNKNLNQNLSQENSKLNGGIYLNESMEKHRKARLSVEYVSKNRNSNLNRAAIKKNVLPKQENPLPKSSFSPAVLQKPNVEKPAELPKNGSIIHKGWVKYFKFSNEALTILTPKEFLKNPGFYQQRKYFPKEDFSKPNSEGEFEFIRNENYFYITIFPGYILFNQSKKVIIQFLFSFLLEFFI